MYEDFLMAVVMVIQRGTEMKKIILALVLLILNTSLGYSATENENRFIYLGQDTLGGHWYLDERDIHIDTGIVDFDVITYIAPSYRPHLIEWLKGSFADAPQRAHDIINRTTKMSQHYLWDVEQSLFCFKNVFFYDTNQRLLYSHSFSAFDNWYPIASNPIIEKAIEWIRLNRITQQHDVTRTAKSISVSPRKDVNKKISNLVNQSTAKTTNSNASKTTFTNNALRIAVVALVIGIGILLILLSIWLDIKLIYLINIGNFPVRAQVRQFKYRYFSRYF